MGSFYLNYRDSLKKKWFKPYGEVTEEARANVPPRLEKDDWNCLVDLWSKQDYMVPLQRIYYQFILNYCLVDLLVYGTNLSFLNVGHVFDKQGKSGQKQCYPHFWFKKFPTT